MLVSICQPGEVSRFLTLGNFVLASSFILKSRQIPCSSCRYQELQKQTRFSCPGVWVLKTIEANVTFNLKAIANDRDVREMVCGMYCELLSIFLISNK